MVAYLGVLERNIMVAGRCGRGPSSSHCEQDVVRGSTGRDQGKIEPWDDWF